MIMRQQLLQHDNDNNLIQNECLIAVKTTSNSSQLFKSMKIKHLIHTPLKLIK
jgi:hypothetical protein